MGVVAFFRRVFGALFGTASSPVFDTVSGYFGLPLVLNESFNQKNIRLFNDNFNRTTLAPWTDESITEGTVSVSGGQLSVVSGASGQAIASVPFVVSANTWVKFTYESDAASTAAVNVRVGTTPGGDETVSFEAIGPGQTESNTFLFVVAGTYFFNFRRNNPANTILINNVLIEEVPALDGWKETNADPTIVNDIVNVENTAASQGFIAKAYTTVIGVDYNVQWDNIAGSDDGIMGVDNVAGGTTLVNQSGVGFSQLASFTATATQTLTSLIVNSSSSGADTNFDNVSVIQALVANGTFDADTDWTKGTGWTISGGVASKAAEGTGSDLDQALVLVGGTTYRFEYTISNYVGGTMSIRLIGSTLVDSTSRTSNGTFIEFLVAPESMTTLRMNANTQTDLSLDNIIITVDE